MTKIANITSFFPSLPDSASIYKKGLPAKISAFTLMCVCVAAMIAMLWCATPWQVGHGAVKSVLRVTSPSCLVLLLT